MRRGLDRRDLRGPGAGPVPTCQDGADEQPVRRSTMRKIRISAGSLTAKATLYDNGTADAIWEALPLSARGNRWGDEIYFSIPVHVDQAGDARDVMETGLPVVSCPYMPAAEIPMPCWPRDILSRWNFEP